ncbi:hypothetical protein JZX87_13875 [Agrobacterium sp. Ap1]|uniref:pyocin knob domain-containing protein n=1 Tax=Agrobacterium sp. Ap1 TaxID=2815337 RepID=UPI001A8F6531|nr:pyocin knob domain-containing protein [Agrobacterium sp. Ap1]MBO0142251.1 hypothetical protein [Agrobacterium sp. Ap1]
MAIQSDYVAGTISAAAGGTAVSGVGTAWLAAGFREGDEFFAPGWHGIVQSVESNTSLTLYPIGVRGAALSGASYRVRYQGDNSRVTAQARQLIELLGGSGNIEALSGLVGAADKLQFFTGAGTMGLTALTLLARTLLSRTTGAAVYGDLGTIPNGQLPPRIRSTPAIVTDLNTINENGWSVCDDTAANRPPVTGYWLVETILWPDLTQAKQKATSVFGTNVEFSRSKVDGVWRPWRSYSAGVVGPVSQASGVPSGAIIERGINANGEYVRFADGTQICRFNGTANFGAEYGDSGLLYRSSAVPWSFPAAFAVNPTVSFSPYTPAGSTLALIAQGVYSVSPTSALLGFAAGASLPVTSRGFHAKAHGTWF